MHTKMRALASTLVLLFVASGCAGTGPKPSTQYTTPPETTGVLSLESPRLQQIALARRSNDLFSIFPAKPGSKTCEIPEGGVHFQPLTGTCSTHIRPGDTHEPTLVVSFTEYWTNSPNCPGLRACSKIESFHHRWRVIEAEPMVTQGARLRIAATQESGSPAPQYYK